MPAPTKNDRICKLEYEVDISTKELNKIQDKIKQMYSSLHPNEKLLQKLLDREVELKNRIKAAKKTLKQLKE